MLRSPVLNVYTSKLSELKNGMATKMPGDKTFDQYIVCTHSSRTEQVSQITMTPALNRHITYFSKIYTYM